jgi:hypothetical protein
MKKDIYFLDMFITAYDVTLQYMRPILNSTPDDRKVLHNVAHTLTLLGTAFHSLDVSQ